MKISKHWDGPDPGGTPGRVFTSSIGQELMVPGGPFCPRPPPGAFARIDRGASRRLENSLGRGPGASPPG